MLQGRRVKTPLRAPSLFSKAHLRRLLKAATGARRVSDGARRALETELDSLAAQIMLACADTFEQALAARAVQGLADHMPDLQERHIHKAFSLLADQLKKTPAAVASWPNASEAEGVRAEDGAPETV